MVDFIKHNQCPNNGCEKYVVKLIPLFMDNPPTNVVKYSYMGGKTIIGRMLFHADGTMCYESFYIIKKEKLKESIFLRLGNPEIDPRN